MSGMMKKFRFGLVGLTLLVQFITPVGMAFCEAAPNETHQQIAATRNPDAGAGEADIIEETEFFDELLANISTWMESFLISEATRNTSAVSSWNH